MGISKCIALSCSPDTSRRSKSPWSHILSGTSCADIRHSNRTIANIASKVCSVVTGEPSNSLLAKLEKDSLLNEISSDQFIYQVNDYSILAFYETRMMSVKVAKRNLFPQSTNLVNDPTGSLKDAGLITVVYCQPQCSQVRL